MTAKLWGLFYQSIDVVLTYTLSTRCFDQVASFALIMGIHKS